MRLVFCSDPLNPRAPEPAFAREVAAARELGLAIDLIDHDAVVAGQGSPHLEAVSSPESATYRGWMLTPRQYASVFAQLAAAGRRLITSPAQYEDAHCFPGTYPRIEANTPRSCWFAVDGAVSFDEVMARLAVFGDRPLVLKDWVKSQKHAWLEACFIPRADDRRAVECVVRRFVELQGPDLIGGLVFREYVDLEQVGVHRSGTPHFRELRQVFLDGRLVMGFRYWDEVASSVGDEKVHFADVAARVQSRLFTMDVARKRDGTWVIAPVGRPAGALRGPCEILKRGSLSRVRARLRGHAPREPSEAMTLGYGRCLECGRRPGLNQRLARDGSAPRHELRHARHGGFVEEGTRLRSELCLFVGREPADRHLDKKPAPPWCNSSLRSSEEGAGTLEILVGMSVSGPATDKQA